MSVPLRDIEFQGRLHRLVDVLMRDHTWKNRQDVKRHIDLGLVRRLYMLEHSIRVLSDLPPDGSDALSLHRVEEANVALNALYLNVRGALDNAAWALIHKVPLIDEPDEQNGDHRRFAHLLGKRFLQALLDHDAELASTLGELTAWGKNLADFRDPAAHRIPLYIPPSVLDESGAARVGDIDGAIEAAAASRDWSTFHERMMERWNTGSFQSVLMLSDQERLAMVNLRALLNRDLDNLLHALELVVAFAFAEGVRPVAYDVPAWPVRKQVRSD
jgi:hypothetical protein